MPGRPRRGPRATAGVGRLRGGERTRVVSPALGVGRRQGRQRLVGASDRRRRRARRADRRPDPRPAAASDALGLRLRPARPGRRVLDGRRHRGLHRPGPSRHRHGRRARQPPADRPGDRGRRAARRRARPAAGTAGSGLAIGAGHPAGLDPGHRPARRRGRPVGRPAQEVAPVREQGADRRRGRRRRRRGPARRVLPDLPGDRSTGRLPDPDRARVSRRLGRVPAGRSRPVAVRPDRRRRAASRRSSSSGAGRGSSSRTAG